MVRGSARAHCDSGYWPAKEGRTRFLSARTLSRTSQARSLFPSLFFSFLFFFRPLYDGGAPRRLARTSRPREEYAISLLRRVGSGAIKVSLSSGVSTAFLERTSVSYIQHCERLSFIRAAERRYSPPVLNSLPRVENLIPVRRDELRIPRKCVIL